MLSVTALGCAPWEALTEWGELPGPPPEWMQWPARGTRL